MKCTLLGLIAQKYSETHWLGFSACLSKSNDQLDQLRRELNIAEKPKEEDLESPKKTINQYKKIASYPIDELLCLCFMIDQKNQTGIDDPHYQMPGIFGIEENVYQLKNKRSFLGPISEIEATEKQHLTDRLFFLVRHCLHSTLYGAIRELDRLALELTSNRKAFKWLIDESKRNRTNFTEWALAYFEKKPFKNRILIPTLEPTLIRPQSYVPQPSIPTEIHAWLRKPVTYHQNLAMLILNKESNQEAVELYLKKMREAWSQKCYRDQNNGKKACLFQLQIKHINLLNELAAHNRRHKNNMIEILIENACEELGIKKKSPRM